MAYLDLLTNTCTVRRNTPGVAGDYGTPVDSWADVASLTDIDCRLMAASGREVKVGAEVVIADRHFRSAWGTNKKEAEQKAALYALVELGVLESTFPDCDD